MKIEPFMFPLKQCCHELRSTGSEQTVDLIEGLREKVGLEPQHSSQRGHCPHPFQWTLRICHGNLVLGETT